MLFSILEHVIATHPGKIFHVRGRPYMISDGMGEGGVQPNLILYLRGH